MKIIKELGSGEVVETIRIKRIVSKLVGDETITRPVTYKLKVDQDMLDKILSLLPIDEFKEA